MGTLLVRGRIRLIVPIQLAQIVIIANGCGILIAFKVDKNLTGEHFGGNQLPFAIQAPGNRAQIFRRRLTPPPLKLPIDPFLKKLHPQKSADDPDSKQDSSLKSLFRGVELRWNRGGRPSARALCRVDAGRNQFLQRKNERNARRAANA